VGPTVVKEGDNPKVARDNIRDSSIVLKMVVMVSSPVPGRKAAKERKPADDVLFADQIMERRVIPISRKGDTAKPSTDALCKDLKKG
jgi:hypothetical protein